MVPHLGNRAQRGADSLAYVKLASRVGVGLVLVGSVYRGAAGLAGELGHLTVDPGGPPCWCGSRGCLELYAGGAAMLRELSGDGNEEGALGALVDAALAGDPETLRVVRDAACYLGRGVAALTNLVDLRHVVIGGELSRLAAVMLDPLREELSRCSFVARAVAPW